MKPRSPWRALPLALATALPAALPLAAQPWSFSATVAGIGQSSDGSDGSFRSQLNLDDGFLLEALELAYGGDDGDRELELKAWGFGGAEPAQGADLTWRFAKKWRFDLEYRRNESFFQLAGSDLNLRRDDWQVSRWGTELTWDGWRAARLSLGLRLVERSGTITQPFRELNALYLLGSDLDESRREATFRLETFTLPVKLVFEQSYARLERRNEWLAASGTNVGDFETSPNLLVDADNDRREDRDIPASRLVATYGNDRVEVTGGLLWSPAELDVTGETSSAFAIDGGRVGQVQFADDLLGSASLDAFVAQLDVGIRLAPEWTLRLSGDRHDRAQDAMLAGNRILRLTNALGDAVDVPQAIDERTFFDVTDSDVRVQIEYRRADWSVWAGYFDASRDVDYLYRSEDPTVAVNRTSDGGLVGVAWRLGRRLKASVEHQRGSFTEFVFRTDPETVDRTTLKLRANLAKGWQLRLHGRFEAADNPASQSSLDRSSDAFGVGAFWASEDGKHDFGFDLDRLDLTSETNIVLPGIPTFAPVVSRYDLSLTTFGAHGRTEFGRARLTGSVQRVADDGDTWPLAAWTGRARLAFKTSEKTEVALFGQLWSYDEDLAEGDDFDVTRYGVAFSWRNP